MATSYCNYGQLLMEFLRFLASIPGRLLAIILGVTVLPMRLILGAISQLIVASLMGIGIAIAAPIGMALYFSSKGMAKSLNFLLNMLIILPLVALVATIALASLTIYTLYRTLLDLDNTVSRAFNAGLSNGLNGFIQEYRAQNTSLTIFIQGFSAFLNRRRMREEQRVDAIDFDGFQQVVGELIDVAIPARVLEVPDMQTNLIPSEDLESKNVLTPIELNESRLLIQTFEESKTPLAADIKAPFELLKTRVNHYIDLSTRLSKVKVCLENKTLDEIEDQLIPYTDVEKPILFFKQYQEAGEWHSVPAQSYVTNKDSLLTWLQTQPTHPLNRDALKNPSKYDEKNTRYQWHELTAENCSAQELKESAIQIRDLLISLTKTLQDTNQNTIRLGSSSNSIFSSRLPGQEIEEDVGNGTRLVL